MDKNQKMTSHFEQFISVTLEQEIPTKFLKNKRAKNARKEPVCGDKCCLFKKNVEDVIKIIKSCPFMPVQNYHLPMKNDMVAKTLLKNNQNKSPRYQTKEKPMSHNIYKSCDYEYLWDLSINTTQKVPHNKPDLVIWNIEYKTCNIFEFCYADTNIAKKEEEKLSTYIPLL